MRNRAESWPGGFIRLGFLGQVSAKWRTELQKNPESLKCEIGKLHKFFPREKPKPAWLDNSEMDFDRRWIYWHPVHTIQFLALVF